MQVVPGIRYGLLGPLEVWLDERPVGLGGANQRALLALLLLNANEVVSRERLVEELWEGEPPDTAPKMIQNYVSQLRKLLEPRAAEVLATRPTGYVLHAEPETVDAARFERLAADGAQALAAGDAESAAATLREALALWRGPALADFAYAAFAQAAIARLEEARLAATEVRIEAELVLGRHADLVAELEGLVGTHPLRERLRAHLMLALYRSGRQAEALAVYQTTRELLVDELGIEPSPALQRLERAILRQDAELELDVAAPPAPAAPAAPPRAEPAAARKVVSVVFAEVGRSGRELDPEAAHTVLSRCLAAARAALGRHGATVERLPGGVLLAVLGVPKVHEDDALRAVRAAHEIHDTLGRLSGELEHEWNVRLTVRAGVGTGEVVVDGDSPTALEGEAPAVAAVLQQSAAPGETLICGETARLVRHGVRLEPRDPVRLPTGSEAGAWRLLDVARDAVLIPRRLDAGMIGRRRELAQLRQAFERTAEERRPQLFTVLGPAGIGKSRLALELASTLGEEATALSGRCLPYGAGATFWPLAEIVRRAGGDDVASIAALLPEEPERDLIAARVAGAIGYAEAGGSREETLWAVRKLFESLARTRPLVLAFEDIHWAEPTFLDLIEHVADVSRAAPILLLCLARPEVLEDRPGWGGGKLNATTMLLEPLSEQESETLLEQVLGETRLPPDTRERIIATAEGNPLFLEQVLAMASEQRAAGGEVAVPPTIHALLAARLDRLDADERGVLERAAVAGKRFRRAQLLHLEREELHPRIDGYLETLVRRDLIRPDEEARPGEEGFRFVHLLIRETAYDFLTKQARAELHERFAEWLAQAAEGRRVEYEEIRGYHLEQAYRYRCELGPPGEREARLAAAATAHLGAAGRRAYARGDMPAAVGLLTRAAALPAETTAARAELLVDLGDALRETADFRGAQAVLADAAAAASAAGERALELSARLVLVRLQAQIDPALGTGELRRVAEEAIAVFESLGDEERLAKAWFVLAWAPWLEGRVGAAEEALRRATEYARRAGDDRTEAQSANLLVGAAFWGPLPVPDGIRRCEEILARPPEQRRLAASACRALAGLKAMQGEFEEARALVARDKQLLAELGLKVAAAAAGDVYALVELLAGDVEAAERELRRAYAALEAMGEASGLPNSAAMLAQVLYERGEIDEARRFSELSEQATAEDDLSGQVQWRAARAKVLARSGCGDDAERLAREAVALAETTPDFLLLQADALRDLGEVLRLGGHAADAAAALEAAHALYERKGNVVAAGRARELAGALAPGS